MNTLVAISQYCYLHSVDPEFVISLQNEGLIEITSTEEGMFIDDSHLHELELYTRWYHEMGINPEGIDAIRNLLAKIQNMQAEIHSLRSRLRLYESQD